MVIQESMSEKPKCITTELKSCGMPTKTFPTGFNKYKVIKTISQVAGDWNLQERGG